jgi:hypothetical protein
MADNFHKNNTQKKQQCKSFLYSFSHIKVGGKTEFNLIYKMQFLTAMSKFMYISHNFTVSQHVLKFPVYVIGISNKIV